MDLSFLAPIVETFKAHAYGTCGLFILFALFNVLFRVKTPAQWVIVLDSYPRVHAVMDLIRAFVQPVELLDALFRLVSGARPKAPSPPVGGSPSSPEQVNGAGGPSYMRLRFSRARVAFAALVTGMALLCGCAALKSAFAPNGLKTALTDGQKLCVVLNAVLSNEEIRAACQIEGDVADVYAVIDRVASKPRAQLSQAHAAGVEEGKKLAGALECTWEAGAP